MPKFSPVAPRQRRLPSFLSLLAVAVLATAACDDSTGNDDSIANLSVNPPTPTLNVGSVQQLVATPTTSSGRIVNNASVSWSTSVPGVATVDGNGLVTAVGGGTTVITATVGDLTATSNITVLFPVANIALAAAAGQSTTIRQEGSVTIVPTFTDANGAVVTGRQVVWTSTNPAVATVNGAGVVNGLTDGTTNIQATTVVGGVVGSIAVTVSGAPVVATVTLAVTSTRFMGVGDTEQMVATARAASGTVLSLTGRTVAWSSSNAGNATVDAAGLVTNNTASGTSNIRVTVDGVQSNTITIQGLPTLANDTPVTIDIPAAGFPQYIFTVVTGTDTLVATITGGSGDPDIYVIRPAGTTACSPFLAGSNETCRIAAPVVGRWRIGVEAWEPAGDVAGVTVRARNAFDP